MKLGGKQKLFAIYYTGKAKFNATEAYKRAGYKCKNDGVAAVNGHRLLRNDNVKIEIGKLTDQSLKDAGYEPSRLTKLLLDILYADPAEFIKQDKDGNIHIVLDPENQPTIAISEIHTRKEVNRESKDVDSHVTKLRLTDKKWAAEMLSKLLEMKSGDTNITGDITFRGWFKEQRAIEEREKADNESD